MELITKIDTRREIVTFCYEGVSLSVNRKAYESDPYHVILHWVCDNFDEDGEGWLTNVIQTTCKQVFDNWGYILGRF
ncbi:hypothetical protein [Ruegeria sp. HKCCD6604]|uniref:hypothetical protein n=1 Tax=Ruegeria sp. HKCCD6604 TaxID=2683000 RepID=UPI0014928933|nr:hypothetical protein [Ruegeria sp. HKCCD6604]NOC91571.1 hypothetical protein [Ruegeria sp. HKCCD6604]